MTPLCSIIIPTHQHGHVLGEAIKSALAQTAPVEVLVIDDGSTDDTAVVAGRFFALDDRVRVFHRPHRGVASARNHGIAQAIGEYLAFLDADDTIEPEKVERQIEALARNDAGWCFCDTRIIDAVKGKEELASKRYGYGKMKLDGNIAPLLASRNFIPVHAPLIWRPALGEIRFEGGALEDWRFWQDLALVARVRYIPQVLATYRAGKGGRNRSTKAAREQESNLQRAQNIDGYISPANRGAVE